MGKLHRTNAGYLGVSMEETQDPFWTYNKLALPLSQGETVDGSNGGLPVYNTTDAFGTTKGSGTRTDAFASSIVLAVPMDGTNGGTSFSDQSANIKGSGSAQTVSSNGGANTSTSVSKYYGSSGYFDGSNDYLSLGSAASTWKFLHNDTVAYTVECWIYYISFSGINGTFISTDWGSSGTEGFVLSVQSGNNLSCRMGNGSNSGDFMQVLDSAATNIRTNTWTHVAVTYDLTTFRLFINGALAGSTTTKNTPSTNDPLHAPYIGGNPDTTYGTKYTNCYLQDVRIYNGVAKYTSNFIVPESGPSTFDRSPSRKAVSNAGATWQTSVSKFYGGATSLTGTQNLTLSSSDFAFGTGDYTVECWVYHNALGSQNTYFGDTYGSTAGIYFYKDSNNKVGLYTTSQIATGATSLAASNWYHVAVCRAGGTSTIFVNGAPDGSGSDTTNLTVTSYGVGETPGGNSGSMNGYIQDLRVYRGIAKYTSSFTPPARSLVQTARRYPSGMHVLS